MVAKKKLVDEELFSKIGVKLDGIADIMFDRFIDHSKDLKPPEQRLYLAPGNKVVLPSSNIIDGFLFGTDPPGCAKAFEGKSSRDYLMVGPGHIFASPSLIPFMHDGKEVILNGFNDEMWYIDMTPGRTKLGTRSIKQEAKPRPVLRLPWSLSFELQIVKTPMNEKIDATRLYNWFTRGGLLIGLGTYRPKFGRFKIIEWNE